MADAQNMRGSLVNFRAGHGKPSNPLNGSINFDLDSRAMYIGVNSLALQVKDPSKSPVEHTHTISADATDGIFDITGTGGNNSVSYAIAPYTSQQAKRSFDTSTTNPTRTDRLNYNGYLYATKVFSGGTELTNYSHPSYTAKGQALYSIAVDATGHVSNATPYSDKYHTNGTWNRYTYTATSQGGAGTLAFTLPVGNTDGTVARGNHTHKPSEILPEGGSIGSVDLISRSLIGTTKSNKTFGLPASSITVEYSKDGGTTWTAYPLSDAEKRKLFNESDSKFFYLGNSTTSGSSTINDRLRITITPDERYVGIDTIYQWISTNGNTVHFNLEYSTVGDKTTFNTLISGEKLSGWSGPNIRYFKNGSYLAFGGTASTATHAIRMTYYQSSASSNPAAAVMGIRFFGNHVWNGAVSEASGTLVCDMLRFGVPYSLDNGANAVIFNGGLTTTRRLTANGKLTLPSTGGNWNTGATDTAPSIRIATKQTTNTYHPYFSVTTSGDYTVNVGGIADKFGIYGYDANSVANNTTKWSFYINADNGNVVSSGSIQAARGFWGSLTGTASNATMDSDNNKIVTTYLNKRATTAQEVTAPIVAKGRIQILPYQGDWSEGRTAIKCGISFNTPQSGGAYTPYIRFKLSNTDQVDSVNFGGISTMFGFYGLKPTGSGDASKKWSFFFNGETGDVYSTGSITAPNFYGNATSASSVFQAPSDANADLPVIFSQNVTTAEVTDRLNKSSKLLFNPSTGVLTATKVDAVIDEGYIG